MRLRRRAAARRPRRRSGRSRCRRSAVAGQPRRGRATGSGPGTGSRDAPYWFTDVARRRQQRSAVMARFADLVGHRIQFRITEHPVAARAWAADFRSRTAQRARTPETPGRSPGTTSSTSCASGSRTCPRSPFPPVTSASGWPASARPTPQLAALLRGEIPRGLKDTAEALLHVDHVVAGEGWAARPVTAAGWPG